MWYRIGGTSRWSIGTSIRREKADPSSNQWVIPYVLYGSIFIMFLHSFIIFYHFCVPSGEICLCEVKKMFRDVKKPAIWSKILHLWQLFKATIAKDLLQHTIMRTCGQNHIMIIWHSPVSPCSPLRSDLILFIHNVVSLCPCLTFGVSELAVVIFSATYWNEVVVQWSWSSAVVLHKCCMCRLI